MEKTRRTLLLLGVGLITLWVGYAASAVVTPLLAALLLAYIVDPLVRMLQRHGLSRAVASGGVVLISLLLLATASVYSVRQLVDEGAALTADVSGEPFLVLGDREASIEALAQRHPGDFDDAIVIEAGWDGESVVFLDLDRDGRFQPGYLARALRRLRQFAGDRGLHAGWADVLEELQAQAPKVADSAGSVLAAVAEGSQAALSTALGLLTLLVLFPIYLYYSLLNLQWVHDVTIRHLPAEQRPRIERLLLDIHETLSAFFRGRLLTMLIKGSLLLILFLVFGVPFSLALAVFAAVASLIPLLGGIAAMLPPLLLLLADGADPVTLLGLFVALIAVEVIEGYVLIPGLIGKSVGLHPLTVLVSTFVFGDLLGMFGLLVAIPLTAVLKILFVDLVLPEIRRRAGLPADSPLPEPLRLQSGLFPDPNAPAAPVAAAPTQAAPEAPAAAPEQSPDTDLRFQTEELEPPDREGSGP